jgi:uncharacterized DUF497 family protein
VEFGWDPAKDAANLAKHGVSLAAAARLDWQKARQTSDLRKDYGELRFVAYGRIASTLFVCAFVMRGKKRRIISLRKTNEREILKHGLP